MFYTVVKCIFDKHGEIVKEVDLNLEPMTLKEAQIFKSKMMKPASYIVRPILDMTKD